jgi:pimeloyl-ACP methyl ester carboxylesterase
MTPAGVAQLIADFLEALDLRDVTLVGNDTGSGLTQIVATSHPERVARIVLTTGDAFSHFPPTAFKPIVKLGGLPGAMKLTGFLVKPRRVQRAILGALTNVVPDDQILDSYLGGGVIPGVRRDVMLFQRSMSGKYTLAAADKLPDFKGRALIVWAPDDRFFKNEHAYRLADLIPDSRVELIQDSLAFSSEDQPERLTELIAEFMAEPRASASSAPKRERDGAAAG